VLKGCVDPLTGSSESGPRSFRIHQAYLTLTMTSRLHGQGKASSSSSRGYDPCFIHPGLTIFCIPLLSRDSLSSTDRMPNPKRRKTGGSNARFDQMVETMSTVYTPSFSKIDGHANTTRPINGRPLRTDAYSPSKSKNHPQHLSFIKSSRLKSVKDDNLRGVRLPSESSKVNWALAYNYTPFDIVPDLK